MSLHFEVYHPGELYPVRVSTCYNWLAKDKTAFAVWRPTHSVRSGTSTVARLERTTLADALRLATKPIKRR